MRCKHCKATDAEIKLLRSAIEETLSEHGHLADGENCTLIKLKRALQVRNWPTPIPDAWVLWEELPTLKTFTDRGNIYDEVSTSLRCIVKWSDDNTCFKEVFGESFPDAVNQAWLEWKKGEK